MRGDGNMAFYRSSWQHVSYRRNIDLWNTSFISTYLKLRRQMTLIQNLGPWTLDLDSKVKWNTLHVANITAKENSTLGFIRRHVINIIMLLLFWTQIPCWQTSCLPTTYPGVRCWSLELPDKTLETKLEATTPKYSDLQPAHSSYPAMTFWNPQSMSIWTKWSWPSI